MNKNNISKWLQQMSLHSGGAITVVQTLRNAIMAASVLASASLVTLMGVLASVATHPLSHLLAAIVFVLLSCFCSIRTIWLLAVLGFQAQQPEEELPATAKQIGYALTCIKISAISLFLALSAAAVGVAYFQGM